MEKLFTLILTTLAFSSGAYAASDNCPLQRQSALPDKCLKELATALIDSPQTVAVRRAIEATTNLRACEVLPPSELAWQFLESEETGPIIKLEHYFQCDPAGGYDGYRIAGRYYLDHPESEETEFEFLALELISN